jgi:8-oxo-dGTP pyrophosphatase MutT (NUDIX family)
MVVIENPGKIDKKTVGCILTFNGGYLLEHRTKDSLWGSVSGGIHENETPKEAIIREIKEELGLDVEPTFFKTTYHDYNNNLIEYNIFEYNFAEDPSKNIALNEESHSFEFFKINKIIEKNLYEDEMYCLRLHNEKFKKL